MLWLLLPVIIVGALFASSARGSTPAPPNRAPPEDDPVDLLARYGTDADAERLIEQGHGDDLAGLGYHPDGA